MVQPSTLIVKNTAWHHYSLWNRRHEGLAALWVRGLISWVCSNYKGNSSASVLDFGCGYFDVGLALSAQFERADGYDISDSSCEIAARRVKDQRERSKIYQNLEDLSARSYDLILVNSVIQYFSGKEALKQHFNLWHSLLTKQETATVIISDIIPSDYVAWKDALRSLQVAWQEDMFWPMVIHLWKAATKPEGLKLLRIDFGELKSIAAAQGLIAERLPFNLTPSLQRYAVTLSKASE